MSSYLQRVMSCSHDVVSLLAGAQHRVLCLLSDQLNMSFEGLSAAAREARRQKVLSSALMKKCERLDTAAHFARHCTRAKIDKLVDNIGDALAVNENETATADKAPAFRPIASLNLAHSLSPNDLSNAAFADFAGQRLSGIDEEFSSCASSADMIDDHEIELVPCPAVPTPRRQLGRHPSVHEDIRTPSAIAAMEASLAISPPSSPMATSPTGAEAISEALHSHRQILIQESIEEGLHEKRKEFMAHHQPLLDRAREQLPPDAFEAFQPDALSTIEDELKTIEAGLRHKFGLHPLPPG